jgi:hypothetical protein
LDYNLRYKENLGLDPKRYAEILCIPPGFILFIGLDEKSQSLTDIADTHVIQ